MFPRHANFSEVQSTVFPFKMHTVTDKKALGMLKNVLSAKRCYVTFHIIERLKQNTSSNQAQTNWNTENLAID